MFPEVIMMAGEIIEGILNQGAGPYRCKLNQETKLLVDELIAASSYSPFIVWNVMGSVGDQTAYFTLRAKYPNMMGPDEEQTPPPNNVIHVDFKSKTRIKQAA